MKNSFTLITLLIAAVACTTKIDTATYNQIQTKGNSITAETQAVLLANVGAAIQAGGPEYAVEFCNLQASGIVDSLNQIHNCSISRVSKKNRNPENALQNSIDAKIWETFKNNSQTDTVLAVDENLIFYKRINTAMPACLKCHGAPEIDINRATMDKLQQYYPEDLATGYKLNDFRGLWKVEFKSTI